MLNRKVELWDLVVTKTATGSTRTFELVGTVWCKIESSSGVETIHTDKLKATATSKFTMRYRADISETAKLVYKGVDYQIRHINNVEEADKWLIIKGERGVVQ